VPGSFLLALGVLAARSSSWPANAGRKSTARRRWRGTATWGPSTSTAAPRAGELAPATANRHQ